MCKYKLAVQSTCILIMMTTRIFRIKTFQNINHASLILEYYDRLQTFELMFTTAEFVRLNDIEFIRQFIYELTEQGCKMPT